MAKKAAAKKIVFKDIPKGEIKSWKDVPPKSDKQAPKPRPAADVKKGDLRSSFTKGPKTSKVSSALRTVGKVAGPVGAAIGFILDASPAGAGSDKPSGPLMKGNSGIKAKAGAKAGAGASGSGSAAVSTPRATPAPKPKAKPSVAPPKPTAKPSFSKGSSSPPAYAIPKAKPQLGKKVTSGFQGNWTGAAPSEMQKRGGARINRNGGILGAIKRKLGK